MRMRRVSILLVSVLLLSAVFAGTAFADDFSNDSVTVSNIRVSPSSLSEAGTVSVTINVAVDASRADGGLNNVTVRGNGVASDTVQEITIGADADLYFTLSVSAAQLGKSIPLTLKWQGTGATSLPFSVTVGSSGPTEPQVKLTQTVDKDSFKTGESLTVYYNIQNIGVVDISDISVTDSGIPDMPPQNQNSLKAGDSAKLTYTFSPSADITSNPTLSYVANGKSYTATCSPLTVPLDSPNLDAVLEASPDTVNSGDEVTLNCTLTNTGNEKLKDIKVSEISLGNDFYTISALDKDAYKQFSRTVKLTATTTFLYEITAKDEAGAIVSFRSNPQQVTVNQTGAQNDLEIVAVPDVLQLSQPGTVNFNITIRNNGTDPVANVSVKDQTGNVIQQYPMLPVGPSTFVKPYAIDTTTKFSFTLNVPSEGGDIKQFLSGDTEVVVAAPSATTTSLATPSDAPSSASTETTADAGSSGKMITLITALLIVGVLIIIALLVLFALIARDRRRRGGKKR